jgi:dihydrofolate reductase
MRKLAINTFLTLDGVMQAPGGPDEDPTGGFTQGGWMFGYQDDATRQRLDESMSRPFDLLLGRRTYEIFAAHWPNFPDANDPTAAALNKAKKYVASRTLDRVDWTNSSLLKGDVAAAVAKLKAQDGPEIQMWGSANLIQTLITNGLIDEYRLWIFPVLVGQGKRLFADGVVPAGLELKDSKTSTTGVVMATYAPAGEIKRGSFAVSEPSQAEVQRREKLAKE